MQTFARGQLLEAPVGNELAARQIQLAEVRQGALRAQEIVDPEIRCAVVLCTRKDALLARVASSVLRLTVATARELCADGQWIGAAIAPPAKPGRGG